MTTFAPYIPHLTHFAAKELWQRISTKIYSNSANLAKRIYRVALYLDIHIHPHN